MFVAQIRRASKANRWVAPFARKVFVMLFEVKVSQKFALFNSYIVKQVEAPSAEIAAAFVLAKTKKEFPDEKHLYVSRVAEIGDQFIG